MNARKAQLLADAETLVRDLHAYPNSSWDEVCQRTGWNHGRFSKVKNYARNRVGDEVLIGKWTIQGRYEYRLATRKGDANAYVLRRRRHVLRLVRNILGIIHRSEVKWGADPVLTRVAIGLEAVEKLLSLEEV